MGSQKGIVQITGTFGNLTFYKSKDGFLVREKGGIDAKRLKTDPRFQRTRENGAEFARAGKASKVFRKALRNLLLNIADARMTSRLVAEMIKVIQMDEINPRGLRNVIDGEAELLTGFECNVNARLEATLVAQYNYTINRAQGMTTVDVPEFDPSRFIVAPAGATHCRLTSAGASIDFENETFVANTSRSADIDLAAVRQPLINMMNPIGLGTESPVFIAVGIEFFQKVNKVLYPLSNGAFNALSIVYVDGGDRSLAKAAAVQLEVV